MDELLKFNVNLSQLQRNYNAISKLIKPGVKLLAVVKGNAYGHGLVPVSRILEEMGCDGLGVVRMTEASALRKADIKVPVVMLAPILPSQAEEAVKIDLTLMLDNQRTAYEVDKWAKYYNKRIKVHIKINTGLNRFGLLPSEAAGFIKNITCNCNSLEIEGIYTHFRDPEFNKDFTDSQIAVFDELLKELEVVGLRPPIAHAAATGGILMYPEAHYDMIRCGILLYGEEYLKGKRVIPKKILPLTSLTSRILKINEVKAGQAIGYGDKHISSKEAHIAVIAGGYGDGVSRGWKEILINGQKAPIVNYAMDCVEADITDIEGEVHEYDEVVLIGRQGNGTIAWEDACYGLHSEVDEQLQRITDRVVRNYFYEK